MKKKFIVLLLILAGQSYVSAQDNVYPAPENAGLLYIKNAVIHVGNGQVIEGGTIEINKGKITKIGKDVATPGSGAKVIDATGKHVYPGLILSGSNLGLVDINSVRATNDVNEIGDLNPSIRSIVAYNTDSKVINTLRSNGILLVNVVPNGGTISGSSSVVQLDAWNWEDAVYRMDGAIHLRMPQLLPVPGTRSAFPGQGAPAVDPVKRGLEKVDEIKGFFREAKVYASQPAPKATNLKLEAVQGLFTKKQKLFIHCDIVKEILIAVDFVKEFGFDVVLVGASESYRVADLLKQHNIPVILGEMHSLPTHADDDVDQPYKTASQLQKAGVLFAINDNDGQHRGRNLPFNAGTAVAYGLSKEEALGAITLNAAKILGISEQTGSLEVGKDANLLISDGDILDMRTSLVTYAFIRGRQLDLTDKHKQLYERYKLKYGLK